MICLTPNPNPTPTFTPMSLTSTECVLDFIHMEIHWECWGNENEMIDKFVDFMGSKLIELDKYGKWQNEIRLFYLHEFVNLF